jgi:hypothetical protein
MGLAKLIKNYRELGSKEFFRRWKEGAEQATPLDQTKAQLTFTKMTLVGIACGFVVSIINGKNLWWLAIILGAAFGNTYVSYIGLKQKAKLLINIEETMKGGDIENV